MNPTDGIQPTAATGGLESVFSRPGSPAATMGTLDSLRGSQATLDLDRIEATARAATPGRWHEFDGCVWTDVAECLHHGPSSAADREHVATMDPSTTLALVARVREAEARCDTFLGLAQAAMRSDLEARMMLAAAESRLAAVDALHRWSAQPPVIDAARLERQRQWSLDTFGPGPRTLAILDHIRRELDEVAADPTDLGEWVDVVLIALDGAWRAGHEPQAILDAIAAKHELNRERTWPDWRGRSQDEAIEHIRVGGAR